MATYRATIKGWDRHFGSGHVLWSYKLDVPRASKKSERMVIERLEQALSVHQPQQTDKSAEAWAEVSDRRGLRTLTGFVNDRGEWKSSGALRPNAMEQTELDEGLEAFEVLAYRVAEAGEARLGQALLGIVDAVEAVLGGEAPDVDGIDAPRRDAYEQTVKLLEVLR